MSRNVVRRQALAVLLGSAAAAAAAPALRPTELLARSLGPIDLEGSVPRAFGPWETERFAPVSLVNPETEAKLARIYSEILTRTYVDRSSGYQIMMSVAYGEDQSDSLSLHYPDVCYPAQGFSIRSRERAVVDTGLGKLPVSRLTTTLGPRHEAVTYWVMIGQHAVVSGTERKLIQMRYSLDGSIPDGLLFRISSIDRNSAAAFAAQDAFIRSMLGAAIPARRRRLAGI